MVFCPVYSLWISLLWMQLPFLPEPTSGHFTAMQQKPELPRWPQKNQSSSCACRVEVSQEMPTPAMSRAPKPSPLRSTHLGGSKDTHRFAAPGETWVIPPLKLHPALEMSGPSPGLGNGRCGCSPTPPGSNTSQTLGLGTRTQGCHQRDKPKQLPPSPYFSPSAPGGATPAPSSPPTHPVILLTSTN